MKLNKILEQLWLNYTGQTPSAQKIFDLFKSNGESVENDHIAFRTFNDPRVNIPVLAKPFIETGYVEKSEYKFEAKKLLARHYENPKEPAAPRIFISELLLEEFSDELQSKVNELLDSASDSVYTDGQLVFKGNVWGKPSYRVYQELLAESEYAAWLYVYGFRANHFTVSVNSLKNYSSLAEVNKFLKSNGFDMNTSGGEIKGTPEELLEQSSILAEIIDVEFREGNHQIPSCYYEFARRYPDSTGKLYNGFIAKSADKIFESTDFREKLK